MKYCSRCQGEKLIEAFAVNRRKSDGRQQWCRECSSTYNAERYQRRGPGNWRSQVMNGGRLDKIRRRKWLLEYWLVHPCVDCGETDPVVLDFDHVRGQKLFNISRGFYTLGWKRVMAEVEKCESRCSNCHRRKTARDFGWYANLDPNRVEPSESLLPGGGL